MDAEVNFSGTVFEHSQWAYASPPTWAQHVSTYLANVVRHRCRHIRFSIIVWIDNFIILSNSVADDSEIRRVFDEVAASVNLHMKGWTGGGSKFRSPRYERMICKIWSGDAIDRNAPLESSKFTDF